MFLVNSAYSVWCRYCVNQWWSVMRKMQKIQRLVDFRKGEHSSTGYRVFQTFLFRSFSLSWVISPVNSQAPLGTIILTKFDTVIPGSEVVYKRLVPTVLITCPQPTSLVYMSSATRSPPSTDVQHPFFRYILRKNVYMPDV